MRSFQYDEVFKAMAIFREDSPLSIALRRLTIKELKKFYERDLSENTYLAQSNLFKIIIAGFDNTEPLLLYYIVSKKIYLEDNESCAGYISVEGFYKMLAYSLVEKANKEMIIEKIQDICDKIRTIKDIDCEYIYYCVCIRIGVKYKSYIETLPAFVLSEFLAFYVGILIQYARITVNSYSYLNFSIVSTINGDKLEFSKIQYPNKSKEYEEYQKLRKQELSLIKELERMKSGV